MSADWRVPGYTEKKNFEYERWCERLPDINPVYAETVRHHFEVAIHAEAKVFPYEVLRTKAPNQDPKEWDYQCGLYVPYTRSTWTRALNKTKVIANKQNYSITGWDPEQEKYFYRDYPKYHSLESYFFDIVRESKINYPNQLMVVEPLRIPVKMNGEGNLIPDQSVDIEPIVRLIKERDVIFHSENHLSIIADGKVRFENADYVKFKAYDRTSIYEVVPTARTSEGQIVYTETEIYRHDWNYVPCRKLGGKPKEIDGEIFYESVFSGALPDLDEVIRLSSTLTMVLHANAYPVAIQRERKCTVVTEGHMCNGGFVWSPARSERVACPGCSGSGKGPTTVFTVPDKMDGDPSKFMPLGEVLAYVAPTPDTIQPLDEQIDKKKEGAFAHIFKSAEKIQQTAEGSHLEKDEYHSFLVQFSNEFFDLMEFAIEACGWYRYQSDFTMPSVSKPTTFSFRSPQDITTEISEANTSNMPPSYKMQLIEEAGKTRFNSNQDAVDMVKMSMALDDLWASTSTELIPYVGKTLTYTDIVIHQRITSFISRAFSEHKDFETMGAEKQKEIIEGYAEEIIKAIPQPADPFSVGAIDGGG